MTRENARVELTARGDARKTARVTLASVEADGANDLGTREGAGMVGLLGVSAAIRRLRAEIRGLAHSGFRAVLIQGESGVGKEVVAETLRRSSSRATAPYEIYDCPAVPEDHLESELFGTARGAFPGAVDKPGALERGHGGTIFFDEIAAMRREHQAKVLRVIEGKAFRRVGGSRGIMVDVAVIAAAHEDLAALSAAGTFRHDLYYRLIRDGYLSIPPLRERAEDVPVLVRAYCASADPGSTPRVEPEALARLAGYHWPGNVRQLQTVLRIALRLQPEVLDVASVDEALARFGATAPPTRLPEMVAETTASPRRMDAATPIDFHAVTARTQRRLLLHAYEAAAGNKTAAGVLLGFHLSPDEERSAVTVVSDSRRNLALRKFRYWAQRLGVSASLTRRPPTAAALEPD